MNNTVFPYFGSKKRIAQAVWSRFGNPDVFIDPFCGSCQILLNRPNATSRKHKIEICNDINGFITNVMRTIQHKPAELADMLDGMMVDQIDLTAWNRQLSPKEKGLREHLITHPYSCDTEIAARWIWGQCFWFAAGWCTQGEDIDKIPYQTPHLTDIAGVFTKPDMEKFLVHLSKRLKYVKFTSLDWKKTLSGAFMKPCNTQFRNGVSIFFDPPYGAKEKKGRMYVEDTECGEEVREWALKHAYTKNVKIAICGHKGHHDMPDDWEEVTWTSICFYKHENRLDDGKRERIWFSPNCKRHEQLSFLDSMAL